MFGDERFDALGEVPVGHAGHTFEHPAQPGDGELLDDVAPSSADLIEGDLGEARVLQGTTQQVREILGSDLSAQYVRENADYRS